MRSGEQCPRVHPTASRQILWALQHGHILLLKHELVVPRGIRRVQTYVALWGYLRNIDPLTINETMDYQLAKWLCPMFLRLRMDHPAKYHFLNRLSIFDDGYADIVEEAVAVNDAEAIAALLAHDDLNQTNFSFINSQLMEIAISYEQTRPLKFMRRNDLNTTNIIKVMTSGMPDPDVLGFLYRSLRAGVDLSVLRDNEVYRAMKLLCSYTDLSAVAQEIFKSLLPETAPTTRPYRKNILLHKACLSGDIEVADLLLRNSANPNTRAGEGSCLDATLFGLSQGRLSLVWLLLKFSANTGRATVVRAIQLRQWALALYLLSIYAVAAEYFDDSGYRFQDPLFLVNTFDHLDEIDTLFRCSVPIPVGLMDPSSRENVLAPLLQLPILESNRWLDWQFFFVPTFSLKHKWSAITFQEEERLTRQVLQDIVSMPSYMEKALIEHPANTMKEASPHISQCWLQYFFVRADATPWIKITTPNSFSVIAEISRRWDWLSAREEWDELGRIWHTRDFDETHFAVWEDCGNLSGLGVWQLSLSTNEMVQIHAVVGRRRRRWGLVHSGLVESQWAVRELNKSLVLLQSLPGHYKFHVRDARIPKYMPRWSTSEHGYLKRFGFGFAYMSVRIQWLRTLGFLLRTESMTYTDFPNKLLEDVSEIFDAPSGLLAHVTIYRHGVMPLTLEAAFLGPRLSHYLSKLLVRNSHWLSELTSWLEQVDPTIFTWGMGRDAPLSFTRAFETFRDAGVSEDEMERLDSALEVARSKLVGLM